MSKWMQKNDIKKSVQIKTAEIKEFFRDKKRRVRVSVLIGLLAVLLCGGSVPKVHTPGVMAWWGSLYPQFCFSQTDQEPKISFWLAKAFERW